MSFTTSIRASLAIVICLCFGMALSFVTGVATSAAFVPFSAAAMDTTKGEEQFKKSCASCHSVTSNVIGGFGPNLHNIGDVADTRVPGQTAEQYIWQSIEEPEAFRASGVSGHMPAGTVSGVDPEIVRSLIGYLTSLGGEISKDDLEQLVIDTTPPTTNNANIDISQVLHGRDLFFNTLGCNACHSIHKMPGSTLRAPSVQKAGLFSKEYLLSSIRNPSQDLANIWKAASITLKNQRVLIGRVLSETDTAIVLLREDDESTSLMSRLDIDKTEIESIDYVNESPMPRYELSEQDEQALVAFLRTLLAEA